MYMILRVIFFPIRSSDRFAVTGKSADEDEEDDLSSLSVAHSALTADTATISPSTRFDP